MRLGCAHKRPDGALLVCCEKMRRRGVWKTSEKATAGRCCDMSQTLKIQEQDALLELEVAGVRGAQYVG
jgi:hypothetical protein